MGLMIETAAGASCWCSESDKSAQAASTDGHYAAQLYNHDASCAAPFTARQCILSMQEGGVSRTKACSGIFVDYFHEVQVLGTFATGMIIKRGACQ